MNMRNGLPTVGFDRFIRREWLDHALETVLTGASLQQIETLVSEEIQGQESARKTIQVLNRWWFREYPQTKDLRKRALHLAMEMPTEEWLLLHWGMALVNFPLFHLTAETIGRLLRLQGQFKKQDITQRVLETHANIGTIPRAVARIIQSLHEWEILERRKGVYTANKVYPIKNDKALEWFMEILIRAAHRDSWDLRDLVQAPETFPFELPSHTTRIARQSEYLITQYEGINREIVLLKEHPQKS